MKSYSSYRNSGVEWIGEIPNDWNSVRGRFLFRNKKEINKENQELNLLSLTLNGVLNKNINSNEGLRPTNYSSYQVFEKNDLVFKLIDLENISTSRVGFVHERGIMSPVYIRLECGEKVFPKYSYYFHYNLYKQNIFNFLGSGVRSSLTPSNLLEIEIPLPPINEQTQIVSFLDTKTQKIDELIEKTEQKITLLKEKRTSLINHCVTKGLNPNVEMKYSGVEWIGEIPSHWELVRLNVLGEFSKGKGITKDKIKEKGYPCVRNGEIYTTYDRITNEIVSFIDEDTTKESVTVQKGTLLFTGDGETIEEIGKCLVYNGDPTLYVGGGINVFKPNLEKVNYIYMSFLMNSESVVYQKSRNGKGEIVVHIYSKQLKEIKLGLPSLKEQQQIVEYLDEQTQNIDSTIEKETQRIELLKEYHQSLISEVVTGKVDVRDWKE